VTTTSSCSRSDEGCRVLKYLLGVQLAIVVFVMIYFSCRENQTIMILEQPLPIQYMNKARDQAVTAERIHDTVTFLTGDGNYRGDLEADRGQGLFISLREEISPDAPLLDLFREYLGEDEADAIALEMSRSDSLNMLMGAGSDSRAFMHNCQRLTVISMARSPLLPWDRELDLVILPGFSPGMTGGLNRILMENPHVTVLCPPVTSGILANHLDFLDSIPRLVPVFPGRTRLTNRLWSLVLPTGEGSPDSDYELFLLAETSRGMVLISGMGRPGVEEILGHSALDGFDFSLFVGGVDMAMVLEDPALLPSLERVKKRFPDLIISPNHKLSPVARNAMEQVFGDRLMVPGTGDVLDIEQDMLYRFRVHRED